MQKETIQARGPLPIFFSSVTNTSKRIAYQTQSFLEDEGFLPTVTNVGDVDFEDFSSITGDVILILSTFGNGGSPPDGEAFTSWLEKQEDKKMFEKMSFTILGLGNKSFQHFCGNSKRVRESLLSLGAQQLHQITLCNSKQEQENASAVFNGWCTAIAKRLKQKYEMKQMEKGKMLQRYTIKLQESDGSEENWEKSYDEKWKNRLSKQFINYWESGTSMTNDGRSTLWIRGKIPVGMELQPACNVNIYPENVRKESDGDKKFGENLIVQIQSVKEKGKIPYPPISLQKIWKITNFLQFVDINTLKKGLRMTQVSVEVKEKYKKYLNDPEELERNPIRCSEIVKDLKLDYHFFIELGINSVRPYTLASWKPQEGYFDLAVALDPLGLTSNYFKSRPTHIKMNKMDSTFYIAEESVPIVMIANGSGIAPFRSLVEYWAQAQKRPELYLYYGIQNVNVDYYFKQQWQEYQKKGIVKIRVAESRANPEKKVYIQDIIKEDKFFFKQHLFERNGLVFICGSNGMAKGVDTQLFQSIKLQQKIPFKAFKLLNQLLKSRKIVKEVFE